MQLSLPIKVAYRFGYRHNQRTFYLTSHRGVDFIIPKGTPVFAPAPGVVISTAKSALYGQQLLLKLADKFESYMTHFDRLIVSNGQRVERGDLIGYSGNSGTLTTGPHLHWHLIINTNIFADPLLYIKSDKDMAIEKLVETQKKKINDLLNGVTVMAFCDGKTYIVKDGKAVEKPALEVLVYGLTAGTDQATIDLLK